MKKYLHKNLQYLKEAITHDREESLETIHHAPVYTVCICNYNMGDTLNKSIPTIVEQLSYDFEILIVDDGSNDSSLNILSKLESKYFNLRVISLQRSRSRLLGETRNLSILAALGKYVLLHIDADDLWDPYLPDFVKIFHKLEFVYKYDFYLSGQQTGIAKRNLLLQHGPYLNIYRCEDRNMMIRLAYHKQLLFLDYKVYRKRLNRPNTIKWIKNIKDSLSHMSYDLRHPNKRLIYIYRTLFFFLSFKKNYNLSIKQKIFRSIFCLPVLIYSLFQTKIIDPMTWEEFIEYMNLNRGTFDDHMKKNNIKNDLKYKNNYSKQIYSSKIQNKGIRSS